MDPSNKKKSCKTIYISIATFAFGLLLGLLFKEPTGDTAKSKNLPIAAVNNSDEVACEQDLPVVAPVLWRQDYTIAYDGKSRNPFWVQQVLTKESITGGGYEREKCKFRSDPQLPKYLRASPEDYSDAGYVRGHMLSAAHLKNDPVAMEESDLMSNTCPQCPHLLKGYWANLEKSIKSQALTCDEVTVITGPLYLPKQTEKGERIVTYRLIGTNDIAVPTHFFRVICSRNGIDTITQAYIIPNEPVDPNTPLDTFKVDMEKVERVSGILFPK